MAAAAKQARVARSAVVVLAGLSTDNGAQEVFGPQLLRAYRDVRGLVDGFWLNMPAKSAQCPAAEDHSPGPRCTCCGSLRVSRPRLRTRSGPKISIYLHRLCTFIALLWPWLRTKGSEQHGGGG